MGLLYLPLELLWNVFSFVSTNYSPKAFLKLCRVCKALDFHVLNYISMNLSYFMDRSGYSSVSQKGFHYRLIKHMAIENHCLGRSVGVDKLVEISDYIVDRVNHRPETRLGMRLKHINVLLAAIVDAPEIIHHSSHMLQWILASPTLYERRSFGEGRVVIPFVEGRDGYKYECKHLNDTQGAAVIVAAWSNNVELLKSLIMEGSRYPVDLVTGDPLNYAARKGYKDIARLLIQMRRVVSLYEGLNIYEFRGLNAWCSLVGDFFTAIHFAAKYDRTQILRVMIAHGSNLQVTTLTTKRTALHIASIYGGPRFTRVLLQHIQDVNPRDSHGNTPLFCAAVAGRSKVLEVLLSDMRVEINFWTSTRSIEWILARKDLVIDFWYSEVINAVDYIVKNCSEAVVKLLIQLDWININGFGPASANRLRQTPLMTAVQYDKREVAQLLLARPDIDVNVRDEYGDTVLMNATRSASYSCLDIILAHPCVDVNLRNYLGQTALAIALDYQYSDVIKILRDAGASE